MRAAFLVLPGQALEPAFLKTVRGWRDLELDPATYESQDSGVGTVQATLTDTHGTSDWLVTINRIDGHWRILSTEPAR